MRKIYVLNRITLDGFFAGSNGENDWFIPDTAVDKATHEMIDAEKLLLGRISYQHLEAFWPTVTPDSAFPQPVKVMAIEVNGMTKVVFSKTLQGVTWENSQLMQGDLIQEVKELKKGNGSGLLILGSGSLIQQLSEVGLIDDYVLILTPVVLGTGMPLFKGVSRVDLKLVETRHFDSGNMVLHYTVNGTKVG